jgi:hypothetical protein
MKSLLVIIGEFVHAREREKSLFPRQNNIKAGEITSKVAIKCGKVAIMSIEVAIK